MLAAEANLDTGRLPKTKHGQRKKTRTSTPEDGVTAPKLVASVIIPAISPKNYKGFPFGGTSRRHGRKGNKLDDSGSSCDFSKTSKQRPKRGPEWSGSDVSSEKMSWVTYGSPLRHKDKVPTTIKPLPAIATQEKLEAGFVNDAVKTFMFHHSRRQPVIPPYNAEQDKCAQAYFQSPIAKAVLERSMQRALAVKDAEIEKINRINKLSFRRRAKESPSLEKIREREQMFRNDAIFTDKLRTKYKDIIPRYDASGDDHCKGYFRRPDVQRLIGLTCYRK